MTALELLRSRADQYETLAEWHAERPALEPSQFPRLTLRHWLMAAAMLNSRRVE
jgi:hypothetical protein